MRLLFASLLLTAACSSAHADRVAIPHSTSPRTALAIAPDQIRAPYDVQVITESGETAPTYAMKGRFYVQGNLNERYTIRITNPTPRRVEAVISVDGLDVVDGEAGDLRKRGYIVPAYGETSIEGFRTSLADVATFRFSSVDNSYAGRKGKARNVGVIAVALFEEQAPPPEQQQVIVGGVHPHPRPYPYPHPHRPRPYDRDDVSTRSEAKRSAAADAESSAPATAAPSGGGAGRAAAPSTAMRPMPAPSADEGGYYQPSPEPAPRTNRPGLGTEFGEQRYSAASYTKFVRSTTRPVAIAELRYNDQAGLLALGIPVQPMPDEREIMTRETANPFPGDHFARPPY